MKYVLNKKKIVILLFLFLTICSVSTVNAGTIAFKSYLDITDAYYTELDNDGYENDIVAIYELEFKFDINYKVFYDDKYDDDEYDDDDYEDKIEDLLEDFYYVLILELELPSGYTYRYKMAFYSIPRGTQYRYFMNHATEPGWYILRIDCYARLGQYTSHTYGEIIFDPPGGSGGGEPILK